MTAFSDGILNEWPPIEWGARWRAPAAHGRIPAVKGRATGDYSHKCKLWRSVESGAVRMGGVPRMRQDRHGKGVGRRLVVLTALALTLGTSSVANASAARGASTHCPSNSARIVCVDLSRQVVWVQSKGRTTWGPVRIRSGASVTPTPDGLWHIYRRLQRHRSTINGAPMPYSQYFDGAIALHGTFTPLAAPPGSLGCVTMSVADAASLWRVSKIGDPVYVSGHRPRR